MSLALISWVRKLTATERNPELAGAKHDSCLFSSLNCSHFCGLLVCREPKCKWSYGGLAITLSSSPCTHMVLNIALQRPTALKMNFAFLFAVLYTTLCVAHATNDDGGEARELRSFRRRGPTFRRRPSFRRKPSFRKPVFRKPLTPCQPVCIPSNEHTGTHT